MSTSCTSFCFFSILNGTGWFLIGITVLTLLLVSVSLLWPAATDFTCKAEKGLIQSLRRAGTQRHHATFIEHLTELLQRTANRLSAQFTEQLERTLDEHPASVLEGANRLIARESHIVTVGLGLKKNVVVVQGRGKQDAISRAAHHRQE